MNHPPDTASPDPSAPPAEPTVQLSVIAPAHNEQDNIAPLVEQVHQALAATAIDFEMILIDDGSTDATAQRIAELAGRYPRLRGYRMTDTPPGRGNGQSAAFFAGLRQARGRLIALLDADLQNDPADLPAMLRLLEQTGADMVQGDRSANRRDNLVRRLSSAVGRAFRRALLGDTIRDTGCSLRLFKRQVGLQLPLQYKGLHRFIPVYTRMLGYRVVEMPVHHRPRTAGKAKYGVWNRALPGLIDLLAVRWMRSRLRPVRCKPIPTGDNQHHD